MPEIALEPQRNAGAADIRAAEAPLRGVDLERRDDPFLGQRHDVPLLDREHAREVRDAQNRSFLENLAGQALSRMRS